ncbi:MULTISPECIES: potassium channel protein [Marinobacter]|uniref:Potassium channel family protein n=1 Tax=Marinobacter xiaoshiensis TaxID=3073652 RepID=A0ABU2HI06_9GAMM|nr:MULTISPECIES: potassium channel family protein [unclassified Marinobacter]MBK1888191.1 two pore domain potassium channel family protein [Marinobacter sp. DY40_1A1]MDS1310647.1 potassium channel family protein [Marinobacter sp. F60267]
MLRNRFPLNAEHEKSKIPMGGLIRKRAKNLFMVLIALLTTHILIIWAVEELTLFESLWMTMTTIATVGYGDYAPVTYIGRISTILFIFVGAITLMTLIVSDFIEYRFYRRERILTGRWIYKMNNHIVIINTPKHGGTTYFMRFATQIRAVQGYETIPIMLLTREFPSGLPAELSDLGIVHYHGSGFDPEALKAVHAGSAKHIVVLAADESDPHSDSLTFDISHRLGELNLGQKTTVECVTDANRSRYKELGVRAVIRPVRTYPEIMVRSVVAPGSEKVLEDMFNYEQDHPHRYDLELDDLNWADIVSALIRHGIGTALAYINHDDEVICHPAITKEIEGKGLIVLVKSNDTPDLAVVEEALERYRKFMEKWRNMQEDATITDSSPPSTH